MADAPKTATKTARPSPRSGVSLPLGNHPGNTGGKKGRSGRKSEDWVAWCKSLTDDPVARSVYAARNAAGDLKVLEMAAHYAHGKPVEHTAVSGELTIRIVKEGTKRGRP